MPSYWSIWTTSWTTWPDMDHRNVYEDAERAETYATLEFPGTYYLAYRDLPGIVAQHIKGNKAIDIGCGTGRSTRFLQRLGFDAVGVDIVGKMIEKARRMDLDGDYRLIDEGDLSEFQENTYDLALAVFTFDNVPTMEAKVKLLAEMRRLLKSDGRIINLVSAPQIYTHEWASFSTKDFPENRQANSGDKVSIVMTDVVDKRPVEDVVWSDETYQETYQQAGLHVVATLKPLAKEDEAYEWVNETRIAPWIIYVLQKVRETLSRKRTVRTI